MSYFEGSSPLGCTVIKHNNLLYHFRNKCINPDLMGETAGYGPYQLECIVTPLQFSVREYGSNLVPLESVPSVILATAINNLDSDGYANWINLEIPA